MIDPTNLRTVQICWRAARRIIRSLHPPIDLFEDIADPADWPLLVAAEQKTNPRLAESIGMLDLVPPARRVGGPGASYLMAPFTHVSLDRPSRFSDGRFGVLYAGDRFEVALFETVFHHAAFMTRTREAPGWTSQFREIVLDIEGGLRELVSGRDAAALDPQSYTESQALGRALYRSGADGIVYPSVRSPEGACAALFYPDLAARAVQGRHLDYHWNGACVDFIRDATSRELFRIDRVTTSAP